MSRTCNSGVTEREISYKAVNLLAAAHAYLSLNELSRITGIAPSILSRYYRGLILPTSPNASKILESLLRKEVVARIMRNVMESNSLENGYFNIKSALGDPNLLLLLGEYVMAETGGCFDYVVAPEAGGISFATSVAMVSRKKLVVARKQKPLEPNHIEARVLRDPVTVEYYYIRKDDLSLPRGRRCCSEPTALIVDDFTIHGATLRSLAEALETNGYKVASVIVAVGMGSEWKKLPRTKAILEIG